MPTETSFVWNREKPFGVSRLAQLYLMPVDMASSRQFFIDGLGVDEKRVGETSCTY